MASRDNLGYRLVEELRAGKCAEPHDHASITRAIEHFVAEWEHGKLGLDPRVRDEALQRFSRRKLAADLGAVLRDGIAGARVRRRRRVIGRLTGI